MSKIYKYGIDISEHQGNFDLSAYKDQFVIIRAAWGTNEDKQFRNNVAKCNNLGIPYGIYLYSYALNEEGAKAEAEYLLGLIKGLNIKAGVWFDMEDADHYKQNKGALSQPLISAMCKKFCSIVEAAGYYTGIYASSSWFGSYIVGCDKYDKWVANWGVNDGNKTTDTSNMGTMQQFTSVPLDRNVIYVDLATYNGGKSPTPTPVTPVTPTNTGTKYTVGNVVSFNKIYGSSTSTEALNPLVKSGTITKVYAGTHNPYLINGNVGFVNDSCIVSGNSSVTTDTSIKAGDNVTVIVPVDVTGTHLATSGVYNVMELNGERAVIGRNGVVTAAINVHNLKKA